MNEFDLLCACAATDPSAESAARIANWNAAACDWGELLRLAEHHGVLPLLARNLLPHINRFPTEAERSLHTAFDDNLRRNLWFASELVRIVSHFEHTDLLVVPYKGPVLAESVYGDLALRSFGDLDILIAPADFDRAKQALVELGYTPTPDAAADPDRLVQLERLARRIGYELPFDSAAGKHLVELQWALLPHFYSVDLRAEDLLARAGAASIGGRATRSLSSEDLLLVLCLHAAKHLWMRLMWTCDVAETMRSQTIDYAVVAARARELGALRIVGVSVWLARHVLGAQVPHAAEEIAASDPQVEILGREFAERLAHGAYYDFESTEYFRLTRRLREHRRDQVRYLWRLFWTPGPGEIAAIRLPDPLSPAYHIVRVLRLPRKMI